MTTICLDYDGSYESFPELFEAIIKKSHELGYTVILATMRSKDEEDGLLKKISTRIPVYYTARKAKAKYLEDRGIVPDIWIDDKPLWILRDAR